MGTEVFSTRPWLLLPGTLCTRAVFDGFLDALGVAESQRRYVTLDRHAIDEYRAEFQQLAPGTIVCGFSLGAIVAAHCADVMAAERLILFGLNPYPDNPEKEPSRRELAQDVTARGGAAALKERLPDVFGPRPEATRAQICQMAEETSHLIEAQTDLAMRRPGALGALAQAKMPVLSVTGLKDHAAPPSQGAAAALCAPDGQFHALDGLGHFAVMEDPKACADVVQNWYEPRHEYA